MAEKCTAHNIDNKLRTVDVKIQEKVDFDSLLLSDDVLTGLKKCGFERPSPIQLKAIPLGRCGLDLIIQAKSGTGKTCVFAVIALESVVLDTTSTQILVLSPTREIAVQIWEVINSIGVAMPKLRCYTFIGGTPVAEDKVKLKKCHIAVGTPGRVMQLIEQKVLNTESIRLFVLDEADKLMEQGFQETINWIYSSLAENKQMLALSATYPEVLVEHLTAYMRNPTFVRLNTSDPSLLGIRQYYKTVPFSPIQQKAFELKCKALMELLNAISFQQCLVFSNYQLRAQSLSDILNKEGWPATFISGSQVQEDRLVAMAKLKTFKCRVLISTDLTSRGIDAENVNLVVNLDIPYEHETYLHRIGRAGRFGTYGAAVTFASLGKEMADLKGIQKKANTIIKPMPDPVPANLAQASGYIDYSDHITAETLGAEDGNTLTSDQDVGQSSGPNLDSSHDPIQSRICAGLQHSELTNEDPEQMSSTNKGHAIDSENHVTNTDKISNDLLVVSSNKSGTTDTRHVQFSSPMSIKLKNSEQTPGLDCSEVSRKEECTVTPDLDELINDFHTKLQSEYVNIERLLEGVEKSSGVGSTTLQCPRGPNGDGQLAPNEDTDTCKDVTSTSLPLVSRITSTTKLKSQLVDQLNQTADQTSVSDCSSVPRSAAHSTNDDKLGVIMPTVKSLQQFYNQVKCRSVQQLGLVLPKLSDIIGVQHHPDISYNELLADMQQFHETGKSNLQPEDICVPQDNCTYLEALQKVEKLMKNLDVEHNDDDNGKFQDVSGKLNTFPENDNLDKQSVVTETFGHDIVTNGIMNNGFMDSEIQARNLNPVEQDCDRIVGFCELNSQTGLAKPTRFIPPTGARSKVPVKTDKIARHARNKCLVSQSVDDKHLGRDAMKKLMARVTDSDSSASTFVESDTESDEYSSSAYVEDEAFDEEFNAGSEDYHGYYGTGDGEEKHQYDGNYLEAEWEPVNGTEQLDDTFVQSQYSEPQHCDAQFDQSQYSQPEYYQYDHNGYNCPRWHGSGAYYDQSQWDNQGQTNHRYGYNMGSQDYGSMANHNLGQFPHELWMQCNELLGSINAMQATQYAWYCQQQYYYHMQYAQMFQKLAKKDKDKLAKQQKVHKRKRHIHKKAELSSSNENKM